MPPSWGVPPPTPVAARPQSSLAAPLTAHEESESDTAAIQQQQQVQNEALVQQLKADVDRCSLLPACCLLGP